MPGANAAQLSYTLYVLALPLADATLDVDLPSPTYRIGLHFHTTGIANAVAHASLEEGSNGRFVGELPFPVEYHSNGRLRGEDKIVRLNWRDGMPLVAAITPPNDEEREEVPTALRANTIDPLSSLMLLLSRVRQTGRCDASARSYNGRRLQLFSVRTVGNEDIAPSGRSSFSGRGLRCDFSERTLSGFRFGSGREDDARERRGTIWLGTVFPGTSPLPVRVVVETRWFGDATIYLTAATP
jgi:hypothetical protein